MGRLTDERDIVAAAYNGLCLEAENGQTEKWRCQDVGAPEGNRFKLQLRTGRRYAITVTEL